MFSFHMLYHMGTKHILFKLGELVKIVGDSAILEV